MRQPVSQFSAINQALSNNGAEYPALRVLMPLPRVSGFEGANLARMTVKALYRVDLCRIYRMGVTIMRRLTRNPVKPVDRP